MYFRCDKNGDGKLSEDEVKEVRKKTYMNLLFLSSLFSSKMFMSQNSENCNVKGYSFERLCKQARKS